MCDRRIKYLETQYDFNRWQLTRKKITAGIFATRKNSQWSKLFTIQSIQPDQTWLNFIFTYKVY